jgi:hypothetical protein
VGSRSARPGVPSCTSSVTATPATTWYPTRPSRSPWTLRGSSAWPVHRSGWRPTRPPTPR